MESERKQDEQAASTEREEELINTPASAQSDAEEVSQEVAQNENELILNEICDQAPAVPCQPKRPDVGTANTTTKPLLSSSNKTSMKFYVRNLKGHNDVICGVDCLGSILVSGRYVSFKLFVIIYKY